MNISQEVLDVIGDRDSVQVRTNGTLVLTRAGKNELPKLKGSAQIFDEEGGAIKNIVITFEGISIKLAGESND